MTLYDDGFGNRLQQNAVKGTVPTQSVLADMNTNRLQNWSYDANGNAVNIPGVGSLTYDISNRVKTVGGETYEYAPDNKRIWKNDTYFLWSGGVRIGTFTLTQATNFSGDPNQVGEDPPGGVGSFNPKYRLIFAQVTADYYFGGRKLKPMDRLGSQGGSNYYPYGEERTVTANPADKFATYHRDGTGLDYADQRYYAAGSGRFVTVDPFNSGREGASTSWNRYSYTEGDPNNFIDPHGTDRIRGVEQWGSLYCNYSLDGEGTLTRYNCFLAGVQVSPRLEPYHRRDAGGGGDAVTDCARQTGGGRNAATFVSENQQAAINHARTLRQIAANQNGGSVPSGFPSEDALADMILAWGGLESSWGTMTSGNNWFGLTPGSNWIGGVAGSQVFRGERSFQVFPSTFTFADSALSALYSPLGNTASNANPNNQSAAAIFNQRV